ncbi:hypothetical protein P171DRAFT_484779 [Karstenula rhodostoma CBS 690.94]|uniref:Uncharacterized protein n=1 Tax=Karstenula rhodostoma CBS 690.94 TaxID=1392251 RepID=A0A9P4PGK2_9PLEO|nr:hypothetical protein P171DRAFT_484779 [Karstenula rhodostoma CBS 690.94]
MLLGEATEDQNSDIEGSRADSIQFDDATEQTKEDPTAATATPAERYKKKKKRGLGRARRLKMKAKLAKEQAAKAEADIATTANVEPPNANSTDAVDPDDESREDTKLGELAVQDKEPGQSNCMDLQQQDLEAQQAHEVQQAQEVEQAQKAQSSSIHDAIEKTGIPNNLSQLEAITSGFAKHFGLDKTPNVLSNVPSHELEPHRTRIKRKTQTLFEKLDGFMQGKGTPQSLDALLSHVTKFEKASARAAGPNFFRYISNQDAAYFGRLMEVTGMPLAKSMEELHRSDTLASLFQPEASVPTVPARMIRDSSEAATTVAEATRLSGNQSPKHLRYQDALLSLLNFGASLPTTSKYSYRDVLAEESSDATQAYNQSTPYVQDGSTAVENSSLLEQDQTLKPLGANQRRKAGLRQIDDLNKRLRALEVENRFLRGMYDEELLDEARVNL